MLCFSFILNCKQQIEPYVIGSVDKKECVEKVLSVLDDQSSERVKNGLRRSSSPDYETKEIKNIYIDCEWMLTFFLWNENLKQTCHTLLERTSSITFWCRKVLYGSLQLTVILPFESVLKCLFTIEYLRRMTPFYLF